MNFNSKTVLISGAASGIGCALAKAFCEAGAHVYAGDINEEGLQTLVENAKGAHAVTAVKLDVSQKADYESAIAQIVEDHGALDIVINNAGIVVGGLFNETSMEQLELITNINFWGVVYGTKLALAQMYEQGYGQIANVSSSAGLMPVPNSAMYSGLKHAVVGLSHSLREEAELQGVQVNVIIPGMVESNIWDDATDVGDYDYRKNMESAPIKAIPASEAAEAIMKGMDANERTITFPFVNKLTVWMYRHFPALMTKIAIKPLAQNVAAK